jgi:hypothetical protein
MRTSASMVTSWMLTVFSICQAAMAKNSPVELSHLSIRKNGQGGFGRLSFAQCASALKEFCAPGGPL